MEAVRMRMCAIMSALVFACTATHVEAQALYVTGGWGVDSREPGWYPAPATPAAPQAASAPSITAGAGTWLPHDIGVEASFSVFGAQSISWHYDYLFGGSSDDLTHDRDLPLIGLVRIAPLRRHRFSVEPVIGAGVNFHRAVTFITADCGSGTMPTPCVSVTPPREVDSFTTAEWALTWGGDVAINVSSRASVVPGLRFSATKRPQFLTSYDFRGPYSGGGYVWGIVFAVRYLIHQ